MDQKDSDFRQHGDKDSSLPSRKEYHQRKKRNKKRGKSPFLLSRIVLVLFMAFVIAILVFSISNFS